MNLLFGIKLTFFLFFFHVFNFFPLECIILLLSLEKSNWNYDGRDYSIIRFILQEALVKRLGPNAHAFTMEITPLAPPSVQLVPAKEYNGAPIGTSYDVRAYIGEGIWNYTRFTRIGWINRGKKKRLNVANDDRLMCLLFFLFKLEKKLEALKRRFCEKNIRERDIYYEILKITIYR